MCVDAASGIIGATIKKPNIPDCQPRLKSNRIKIGC